MIVLFIYFLYINGINAVQYDCYTGKPATKKQVQLYTSRNNTQYCLIDVKPCNPNDWSRTDASCTNLKYPSRGTVRTPTRRVLSPVFSSNKDYSPRKAKDGKDLPMVRHIRTRLLEDGRASNLQLTLLVNSYLLVTLGDANTLHDILNTVFNTTNCCTPEGKSNYICDPIPIPSDDTVHRFSNVRCMNLTKPQSFQYFGCRDFGTEFVRITFATLLHDLGPIYGNTMAITDDIRSFSDGMIKVEVENGKIFPISNPDKNPRTNRCGLNILPRETRCHLYILNGAVGPDIVIIAFYRQHNYIAKKLRELNPCWDDDTLFNTARNINIAIYQQILFCELLPIILGKQNMDKEGLSCPEGFREVYDESVVPQMSDEYIYVHRYFHTMQESDVKHYDHDGHYLRKMSVMNLTSRTGYLPLDNHMEELYQGIFRQPTAKFDLAVDPLMGEDVLTRYFFASDVLTYNLEKGRTFGFQPYVKYREFCANKSYKSFNSLKDVMTSERIYHLKEVYKDVEDVELMAGMWAEKRVPNGIVPYTVYCLMVDQLKRELKYERHWFEREKRPHAFTKDQLKAIRKATIAGVLCTNADGVTKIQLEAFKTISSKNKLVDCNSSNMGKVDFSAWKDPKCKKQ